MTVTLRNVENSFLPILEDFLTKNLQDKIEIEKFDDDIPNELTKKVIDDVENGRNLSKTFSNFDEFMAELNA